VELIYDEDPRPPWIAFVPRGFVNWLSCACCSLEQRFELRNVSVDLTNSKAIVLK